SLYSTPPVCAHLPFPTRRSSDLGTLARLCRVETLEWIDVFHGEIRAASEGHAGVEHLSPRVRALLPGGATTEARLGPGAEARLRSEEHTSELQSPYDLVCRLLPE